jgi:hypothetical protein
MNMNKIKTMFIVGVGIMLMCLGSGCMQFDYVGQKLTPLKEGQPVAFYNSKDDVPPDTYKIIGRAAITAPDGTNTEDVKAKLLEKARAFGADAIEVVLFKRVKTGEVIIPQYDTYGDGPVGSWAATSNRQDGTPIYTDTFVNTTPLKTTAVEQYEIRAKVLFLATKEKFKKTMEKYKKDRQSYLHGSSRFAQ